VMPTSHRMYKPLGCSDKSVIRFSLASFALSLFAVKFAWPAALS
jgi:hypothetical protein